MVAEAGGFRNYGISQEQRDQSRVSLHGEHSTTGNAENMIETIRQATGSQ